MTLAIAIFMGVLMLLGVGIIVCSKNVVHAAYALALVLVGMAGVYVLLHAELLAVVQILLYAGGVVILLVFGVMMTNRLQGAVLTSESRHRVSGVFISLSVFVLLIYLFSGYGFEEEISTLHQDQVREIGIAFLTDHLVAFELVAFILLVALVGASYLAKTSTDE